MDTAQVEKIVAQFGWWCKVVGMLQQNWAIIKPEHGGQAARAVFVSDTGGMFDEINFDSAEQATAGLLRNGFRRYDHDEKLQAFVTPPEPPFRAEQHPNGPIYSSGRYWT